MILADEKAKTFLSNAIEAKTHAFTVIIALLLTTVIASIFSSYYAVRRLNSAQIEMKSRMHLIDQNILMAKLDKNGIILDISNHLCRYFELSKNEMINKQSDFFISDDKSDIQPENILKIASTGKIWEGEICRENTDGKVKWIHSIVHPELDENYEVHGYTNIIHDVTAHKAVEELSITDTLTGLYNRRYFDNIIEKEVKIANRNKMPLSFAVIDIDFFKKYNDHYGHPMGDSALLKVAEVFKQSLKRPNDYAFRLGGEEFGIIFSNLNSKQTSDFLEIIKTRVEALEIEHVESDASQYLSLSIGAHVKLENNIVDANQLYVKADEALYKAKVQRNCVVVS